MQLICKPCAAVADMAPSSMATPEVRELVNEYRKALAAQCKGGTWCDCQHRGH